MPYTDQIKYMSHVHTFSELPSNKSTKRLNIVNLQAEPEVHTSDQRQRNQDTEHRVHTERCHMKLRARRQTRSKIPPNLSFHRQIF